MFQFLLLCHRKINLYFSCSQIETRCLPLMHQIAIMLCYCWKCLKPLQNIVISALTYTKHLTTSPSSVFLSSLCPSVYQLLFSFSFFNFSSPTPPPAPPPHYITKFPATAKNILRWGCEEDTALLHCRPRDLQWNYLRLNWACCWLVTSRDMLITTDLLFEFPIMGLDCFPVGGENGIIPPCGMANSRIHRHWVSKEASQN